MDSMPRNFTKVLPQLLRERAEETGFAFGPAVALWDESKRELTLPDGDIELATSLEAAKITLSLRLEGYPFFVVTVGEITR